MPKRVILVLNAGSSSLKFALFEIKGERPEAWVKGQFSEIGRAAWLCISACREQANLLERRYENEQITSHCQAIQELLDWIAERSKNLRVEAAGHRVVHGGRFFTQPQRISAELIKKLDALSPLAPHHQPHNLNGIRALVELYPNLPQVACFDTAFHSAQPETSRLLQLPMEVGDPNLMKYGFHGLSYESILNQLPDYCAGYLPERTIIAHLGNGASLAAIKAGRSLATSMGFSTLDGLLMGSRCGTIDPGVLLYLMREHNFDEPALTDLLYNRSGLLGVSGIDSNMRELLASEAPGAERAVSLYIQFLIQYIGAYTALLQGMDALVFTGGVGENAAQIRSRVLRQLGWLGIELDEDSNTRHGPLISRAGSRTRCLVLHADEESVIAHATLSRISGE